MPEQNKKKPRRFRQGLIFVERSSLLGHFLFLRVFAGFLIDDFHA